MTAVAIGGGVLFPPPVQYQTNTTTATLDATTDYVGYVITAPATGTIDKIHIRTGTSTLTGTLNVQCQTLDAGGDPSGSAYGSSATGTQVNPASNTNYSFTVTTSATAGDSFCIKVWADPVTSGSVNIAYGTTSVLTIGYVFPYPTVRTTGTGAGTHGTQQLFVSVEYSGGVFYDVGALPCGQVTTAVIIDNDGAIRRAGNRAILTVPVTAIGMWAMIDADGDTTTLKTYDTDGTTVLGTVTLTAANRGSTSGGFHWGKFDSTTTINLSKGTANAYRCVVETTSIAANVTLRTFTSAPANSHFDQMPLGAAFYSTAYDGASWTDTNTSRNMIGWIISKADDGTGGGGGLAANPIHGFVS